MSRFPPVLLFEPQGIYANPTSRFNADPLVWSDLRVFSTLITCVRFLEDIHLSQGSRHFVLLFLTTLAYKPRISYLFGLCPTLSTASRYLLSIESSSFPVL